MTEALRRRMKALKDKHGVQFEMTTLSLSATRGDRHWQQATGEGFDEATKERVLAEMINGIEKELKGK